MNSLKFREIAQSLQNLTSADARQIPYDSQYGGAAYLAPADQLSPVKGLLAAVVVSSFFWEAIAILLFWSHWSH
jgi:hypothetical protein